MNTGDTIAAISTPPGRGGIGIIRLSGPSSVSIASKIFHSDTLNSFNTPNHAYVGQAIGPEGKPLDHCIATYFKAPHSYTGEDVVELCCHGSPVVLSAVLSLALSTGARTAEPGEFTLRAFLNRRMDLTQAQAVRDLIDAQTLFQARIAMRQLDGSLAAKLAPVKQIVIEAAVHLESTIEFVEDDIDPSQMSALAAKLERARDIVAELERSFSLGALVHNGFAMAIVGRPNVGKSSVFNRLVGNDRAIVTDIPGTTRDALYENLSIGGIPVRLIDTAGIRQTVDPIESMGIDRSKRAIADADILLLILDRSERLTTDDLQLLESVPRESRLVLLNKCDLAAASGASLSQEFGAGAIAVSALTGQGFDVLTETILKRLGADGAVEQDSAIVTDARQHHALERTAELLRTAIALMQGGELEEIILLRLRGALSALGELTGDTLTEDILGQIFSTFCIGK